MILLVCVDSDGSNHDGWENNNIEITADDRKNIIVEKVLNRRYKVTFDTVN
ncbi:hypothetical protein D3C85_1834700 [compost metagenome]